MCGGVPVALVVNGELDSHVALLFVHAGDAGGPGIGSKVCVGTVGVTERETLGADPQALVRSESMTVRSSVRVSRDGSPPAWALVTWSACSGVTVRVWTRLEAAHGVNHSWRCSRTTTDCCPARTPSPTCRPRSPTGRPTCGAGRTECWTRRTRSPSACHRPTSTPPPDENPFLLRPCGAGLCVGVMRDRMDRTRTGATDIALTAHHADGGTTLVSFDAGWTTSPPAALNPVLLRTGGAGGCTGNGPAGGRPQPGGRRARRHHRSRRPVRRGRGVWRPPGSGARPTPGPQARRTG